MAESTIDYDAKVQQALRQVVSNVLKDVEHDGLPGDHHFYIAFKTQAPGVDIPGHLISRFPDEMTIVVQHKFWNLKVHEDYFEIMLSFNQAPENLIIPFDAIVGFVDPSVQFALQFHDASDIPADLDTEEEIDDLPEPIIEKAATEENVDNKAADTDANSDNIVALDAFRRK
ncbi:SspB family protein [Kordiimonas laminariae]|uniref:SspB family protein n=1 Tax=Kordiimonas laminariae TaxID=2917717 RepID=UPI001FF1CA9A|nr:ClpXP protease specificity-enhancing factor SspB [Kordiimonas laminariae]MCK0068531.1 ClpXP protease specificity-enhancing factor SspB [Kordiimonas laminariae]